MARNLVSPGISLREIDLSQVPQATALVGPAFVGTAQNGPMFEPVMINSYDNEYVPTFGGLNEDHYMPYAAKNYLTYGSNLMVVRVGGYSASKATKDEAGIIPASASWVDIKASVNGASGVTGSAYVSATAIPFAILRKRKGATVSSVTASTGDRGTGTIQGDIKVDSSLYTVTPSTIERYFTRDPHNTPASPACSGLYLDVLYYAQSNPYGDATDALSDVAYAANNVGGLISSISGTSSECEGAYSVASTPGVISETNAAQQVSNLFRFLTLQAGSFSNTQCKVSIDNISSKTDAVGNTYGQFDVLVRAVDDDDKNKMVVLERFTDCNLIDGTVGYIARKIGDSYRTFNSTTNTIDYSGNGPNNSKYIRVEVAAGLSQYSRPSGFQGLASINKVGDTLTYYPHRNIKVNQASGRSTYNKNIFFGFEKGTGGECVTQPYGNDSVTVKGVLLYDSTSNTERIGVTGATNSPLSGSYHLIPIFASQLSMDSYFSAGLYVGGLDYKFTLPFFGGHDGYKKSETNATLLTALSAEFGSAVGLLKNADLYEFNTLLIPGTVASDAAQAYIIEKGIDCCEERGDAFYIVDLFGVTADNPANPNSQVIGSYDTNYAGTYGPGHKTWDNENGAYVGLPPSVLAIERFAYNDKIGYPWGAVAGESRGVGKNVTQLKYHLTQDQRDTLYENRINPIATFKDMEAVLGGQKTLQKDETALDRINVRRLLIYAKRLIAKLGRRYLFEGSSPDVWSKISRQINDILADIKIKNGIQEFGVVIDATTNTPDVIDRNEMYGKIYIKPTKAIEKIYFDFIITSQGATFSGI